MAQLVTEGSNLAIRMSQREEFFALKRSFTVPWSHVVNIAQVGDVWVHLRGLRAPGTGFPGVIMLGTTRYQGKKDFCAVYGHKPGLVVTLVGNAFERVLLSTDFSAPELNS